MAASASLVKKKFLIGVENLLLSTGLLFLQYFLLTEGVTLQTAIYNGYCNVLKFFYADLKT